MKKINTEKDKLVLDACCGGRMFWFNKKHPNALYIDIRKQEKGFIKTRPKFEVAPDKIMDFRDLKFPDKSFKLVVWDPPHLKDLRDNSWVYQKYGSLKGETWVEDLHKGFSECYRVLEDYGVLIFKWSSSADNRPNRDIQLKDVLNIIPVQPLFGHTTGSKSNTKWLCFMKIPHGK